MDDHEAFILSTLRSTLNYPNGTLTTTDEEKQYIHVYSRTDVRGKSKKSASGWRDPTFYRRTVGKTEAPYLQLSGHWTHESDPNTWDETVAGYHDFGGYAHPPALTPYYPNYTEDVAAATIACKAKFKRGPVDVGMVLGERRESLQFITDTASRAWSTMKAVKRGNVKEIKKCLRIQESHQRYYRSVAHEVFDAASSLWLANSFAMKPMVADVQGALEALEKKEEIAPPSIFQIETMGRQLDTTDLPDTPAFLTMYGPSGLYWRIKNIGEQGGYVKIRLDYEMMNDLRFKLGQLGVGNLMSLGWNLLPTSFIADYFTNVGTWFESAGSTVGMTFKCGTGTVTCNRRLHWAFDEMASEPSAGWVPHQGHALVRHNPRGETATDRWVFTVEPEFLDYWPRLNTNLSPAKLMNLASLMVQFTKRPNRK